MQKQIDWSRPVRTQHTPPLIGYMMPGRGTEDKLRVALPSLSKGDKAHEHLTVFRYPETGVSRCDGAPSDYDLRNFDPATDGEGIALHPDALKGQR